MFLLILVVLLSAALCPAQQRQPNLLLIVADDMGYGDLGCYGSLQIRTPNLDRLAAAGVRCTQAYVSGSVCAPSRAGLLTGRSGSRFGFEHNLSSPDHVRPEFLGLPLDEPLLPERLAALGYRTGMVGKWHLGESVPAQHPLQRGFATFFGMLGGSHPYWPTVEKNHLLSGTEPIAAVRTPYLTDWFTLEAIDFVRGAKAAEPARPWFLYLAYNTPHAPMQARPEDLAQYAHIHDPTRRAYCAMQHCLDENVGKLVAALRETGQLDDTLLVFLSDNGGSVEVSHAVNAPLRGTKGTFLEGGIRVPTLYHWPGHLRPQVYDRPVSALDVMATFVTAAGGAPPVAGAREPRQGRKPKDAPIYDGVDLLPFFRGDRGGDPHEALYWRTAMRGAAVRAGDWKLLLPSSEFPQLYDLAADVGEQRDLRGAFPEVAARLLMMLNDWEVSLERNPLFASEPSWSGYNRRLYAKTYSLEQPAPDDTRDLWSLPPAAPPRPPTQQTTVFTSGRDGYATFRIPAIVRALDGDLLAFAEGRVRGAGDAGDIDLVLRRSADGGRTWSDLQVLWDDGENTCGNPCAVVDEQTGAILLLATHNLGHDRESQIIDGTSTGTRTVWSLRSADGGRTWSEPRELTASTKRADWTWYATGPGAGIQLRRGPHAGRLVVPCDHIEKGSGRYASHVIVSDDHGESWRLEGSSPRDQVNECEVVEREDGSLLLNMRNYAKDQHSRQVCVSVDGGATFTDQRHDAALIEPICQASLRRIAWRDGATPGAIAFSNPADPSQRRNLTLRISEDDGATWPRQLVLHPGSAAYSCLVALPPGNGPGPAIGCLFEADGYRRIEFVCLPLTAVPPVSR